MAEEWVEDEDLEIEEVEGEALVEEVVPVTTVTKKAILHVTALKAKWIEAEEWIEEGVTENLT